MKDSLRRIGFGPASLLMPCLLAVAVALSAGCTGTEPGSRSTAPSAARSVVTSSAVEVQVAELAGRYGLRFVGGPTVSAETTLEPPGEFASGHFAASKGIGLDLAAHIGKRVKRWRYALVDRSTADTTITATFFVLGDRVVGAVLNVNSKDYSGEGTSSIANHYFFAPPGVQPTPDHVVFGGVQAIDLWGPKGLHREVRDRAQIARVLSMVERSRRVRDVDVASADELYVLTLEFSNGASNEIRIERSKKNRILFLDFWRTHSLPDGFYLKPAPGLTAYLDKLLRSPE